MIQVWQITVDRFVQESEAKSKQIYSILETIDMLFDAYNEQEVKPLLEIINIGLGRMVADVLQSKGLPIRRIDGLLTRIGGADVLKIKDLP